VDGRDWGHDERSVPWQSADFLGGWLKISTRFEEEFARLGKADLQRQEEPRGHGCIVP